MKNYNHAGGGYFSDVKNDFRAGVGDFLRWKTISVWEGGDFFEVKNDVGAGGGDFLRLKRGSFGRRAIFLR